MTTSHDAMHLNSRAHGILDYLLGVLLILLPGVMNLPDGPASMVPTTLGAVTIFYSLLTRYEFGLLKVIPLRVHLGIDVVSGIFLAASPWFFNFAEQVWKPHAIIGVVEVASAILTGRAPFAMPTRQVSGRRPAH
jgi:hypothetical protein